VCGEAVRRGSSVMLVVAMLRTEKEIEERSDEERIVEPSMRSMCRCCLLLPSSVRLRLVR
jgi:hypothetical protein